MPASLSALVVALDGTVSVVWGMREVGHVQWVYSNSVSTHSCCQSHPYKPLADFLTSTSLQLPQVEPVPADKEESEDTKSVSPHTHMLVLLTY